MHFKSFDLPSWKVKCLNLTMKKDLYLGDLKKHMIYIHTLRLGIEGSGKVTLSQEEAAKYIVTLPNSWKLNSGYFYSTLLSLRIGRVAGCRLLKNNKYKSLRWTDQPSHVLHWIKVTTYNCTFIIFHTIHTIDLYRKKWNLNTKKSAYN